MIQGFATPEGTAAFAKKRSAVHPEHWRVKADLTLSSLGLGTYLGDPDDATDARYTEAVLKALELGINVIDSAINYRFQRSERAIGAALAKGTVRREEVLLCTKGGFIPAENERWIEENLVKPGVAAPGDIVAGCHCMTPKYLRHQLDQSRRNLGVETIDVYYVHNPETQVPEVGMEEFYKRLAAAFQELEACVAEGKIRWYGTATWDAYRTPSDHPCHVSLERVARAAGPHFKAIQLPFNFAMMEAYSDPVQTLAGKPAAALEVARQFDALVFTSVPLVQGQLLGRLPPAMKDKFPGLTTDAQRCLQFIRSTPGIVAPLCGMKDARHVDENAKVATVAPLRQDDFASFFGE